MSQSVFKSPEKRKKFRDCYGDVLGRLPFEKQYIETVFGRTFMLAAGRESHPPVILLHGSCNNSASWFQEMTALSGNCRVYAVDIIGEAGNSEDIRPDLNSDAFAQWMKEILDNLRIDHAAFIGNSLGGWMALKFATVFPQRVSRLVLIAAAGITEIQPQFLSYAAQSRQKDGSISMSPSILGERRLPKPVLDFINLIMDSYDPIEELPLYTDNQILRLDMPVTFIGGENDMIIDVAGSVKRLTRLLPSAEIHVLPDCGHAVFNALPFIMPFLQKESR